MSRCGTCQFWSEMIAKVEMGTTVAMCLSSGEKNGSYMPKWGSCSDYESGMPVDLDHVPTGQRQRSIDARNKLREEQSPPQRDKQ